MLDGTEEVGIVVQVLEEKFSLADFSLELVPSELVGWELGGLVDPIGQLFAWLWDNIGKAFVKLLNDVFGELWHIRDYLWGAISGAFDTIGDAVGVIGSGLTSLINSVAALGPAIGAFFKPVTDALSGLGTFLTAIGSAINSVWQYIQQQAGQIAQAVGGAISTGLSNFVTLLQTGWANLSSFVSKGLDSLRTSLGSAITSVGTFLSGVWQGIVSGLTTVYNFIKGGVDWLWQGILGVRDWLYNGVKTVALGLTQLGTNLATFLMSVPGYFDNLWAWIKGGLDEVGKSIGTSWSGVMKFFKDGYDSIASGVGEVKLTLMGFINPLVDIKTGLTPFLGSYTSFLSIASNSYTAYHMSPEVVYHQNMDMYVGTRQFKEIYIAGAKDTSDSVSGILGNIGKGLVDAAKGIWSALVGGIQGFVKFMLDGISGALTWVQGIVTPKSPGPLDPVIDVLGALVFSPLYSVPLTLLTQLNEQKKAGAVKPITLLENVVKTVVRGVAGSYGISLALRSLGEQLKITADIKPFGLGAGIELRLGALLKHLGRVFWRVPDIILSSIGYGFGMWITQPYVRLLNSESRNALPIELPDLTEIQRIANRATLQTDYSAIFSDLRLFMEYYGYSDWSIKWMIGSEPDITSGGSLQFKDRFNRTLTLPLALRAAMPSGSELAVMMVHDIFANLDEFTKVMQVQGYHPDLSSLYYVHHFKYPTLDLLYQFISRVAAGFGWFDAKPAKEGDLGFEGLSPKALSAAYSADPIASIPKLMDKLLPYAKWQDFAGFAWEEGFTADRLIMLDLMADIPMRIDARWMYKWRIIEDSDLMRIVVARGTHPDWVMRVSTAEAMNAFADERTFVRTSLLHLYERGFMVEATLDKKLDNLLEVKILGKSVPVSFLEGEADLLKLRSAYERVYDIVNGLFSDLRTGFHNNIISQSNFMSIIGSALGKAKALMGIDADLDSKFLQLWVSTMEVRRDISTIQRIRYMSRLLIYRATQLAASGEDISAMIDAFSKVAFLAPMEVEIMKTFATALLNKSRASSALTLLKNAIKAKMKAGVMTQQQAIDDLVKAGMTKDEALNFVWAEVKTRVVSIDKLISMAEMVPIDQKTLESKMESEGVPDNEKTLYRPFAVASEIAEEMGRVVTEMITDYANGNLDDATFKSMLDTLATLNGAAKSKYGVDWIVYSPEERSLLYFLAQLRRARKLKGTITGVTVS